MNSEIATVEQPEAERPKVEQPKVEQPKSKGKLSLTDELECQYCVPLWYRDENIKAAIARIKGRLEKPVGMCSEPIAIVCFGPSLNETWEKIKEFKHVMTGSGSHKFLIDHGIKPEQFKHFWHIDVDPREHKAVLLGTPQKGVEYLIASTCHKAVFDLLEGYDVKLWHIFANDEEAQRILPRGEWAVSGGSNVGLRQITLARFLGFTDLHIFGMDGCFGKSGSHASKHPMSPPGSSVVEYDGISYNTTVSMLLCAKQTQHELDVLPDVKATFYGEGLVQAMAKKYEPSKEKKENIIALQSPLLISPEYRELNTRLHRDRVDYGVGGGRHAKTILKLAEELKTHSILDYGCGKAYLSKALNFPIWNYDPAIPEYSETPRPADIIIASDVLEHIEPDKLPNVLAELKRLTLKVAYFVINTGPAQKSYANGTNAHLIQKDAKWWRKKLKRFFKIGTIKEVGAELHIVVSPRIEGELEEPDEERPVVDVNGVKYLVASDTTKFRISTLLTKEPVTIQWLERMKPGDILVDVGANMGGYSLWAAKRGVRVYSFEPSAQNYELLCANIAANHMERQVTAYCAALADKRELKTFAMDVKEAAGSGGIRDKGTQGCITLVLDELVAAGQIPQPTHIKIDVDGLEPQIADGAVETLSKAESVLVEVNEKSERHMEMVAKIQNLGLHYQPHQVDQARRKQGAFANYAEYLFTRNDLRTTDEVDLLVGRILAAPLITEPFPHFYTGNVFTSDFYAQIQANLDNVAWKLIGEVRPTKYANRFVHDPKSPFWKSIDTQFRDGRLRSAVLAKFDCYDPTHRDESLLLKDEVGYEIGPHSDAPAKVVTCLFYLPSNDSTVDSGTSIYVSKKEGFTCEGGPHYPAADFDCVRTMPFLPNSLFAFKKTTNSFHGVHKLTQGPRHTLLYDVRRSS